MEGGSPRRQRPPRTMLTAHHRVVHVLLQPSPWGCFPLLVLALHHQQIFLELLLCATHMTCRTERYGEGSDSALEDSCRQFPAHPSSPLLAPPPPSLLNSQGEKAAFLSFLNFSSFIY